MKNKDLFQLKQTLTEFSDVKGRISHILYLKIEN